MNYTIRLGTAMHAALAAGVPTHLIAAILTTQHKGRLDRLFSRFAEVFLGAFEETQKHPGSRQVLKVLQKRKAILDLIRVRKKALGKNKPTDAQLLTWAGETDAQRIVPMRKAA